MISLDEEIPTMLQSDSDTKNAIKSTFSAEEEITPRTLQSSSDPDLKTGVPTTIQSVTDRNHNSSESLDIPRGESIEGEQNQESSQKISIICEIRPRPRSLGNWMSSEQDCGRERLKKHRLEMAGRVCIPETWGQENLLMNWGSDCSVFQNLRLDGLMMARKALVDECRQSTGNHHPQ